MQKGAQLHMVNAFLVAAQIFVACVGVYQFAISLFGLRKRKPRRRHEPKHSFAVIVAAHNEERVIGALLDNLLKLDYPRELYDIFVICDNCTDGTADVVRSFGLQPCERHNPRLRGKGHAIEWMLGKLWAMPRAYDAVVMFDADNLVNPDFLRLMNDDLCEGHRVIQGYLDTKNPTDSWITAAYGITYWYCNRLWQQSRTNLGMANFLGGTGMCFESGLLKEMGWGATSLVEDLEFTMRCIKRGVYPVLDYDAKVYDEKPITLRASVRQRLRWMQGHFDVARRYFFSLLKDSLKERNFIKFDAALYSVTVYNVLIAFIATAALWIDNLLPAANRFVSIYEWLPDWTVGAAMTISAIQFPAALLLERVKDWRIYAHLLTMPLFLLTWWPITLFAFFTQNNKQWSHTQHTRVIRLEEMRSKQV